MREKKLRKKKLRKKGGIGLSFNPALNGFLTSVPLVTWSDLHNTDPAIHCVNKTAWQIKVSGSSNQKNGLELFGQRR